MTNYNLVIGKDKYKYSIIATHNNNTVKLIFLVDNPLFSRFFNCHCIQVTCGCCRLSENRVPIYIFVKFF